MSWDKYYLDICNTVAVNSKCLSRQIGAILVRDKSIISTGYNGPPRGVPHCSERRGLDVKLRDKLFSSGVYGAVCPTKICPRQSMGYKSGEGLEWCIASHAERSSLINAARHGIATKDAIMCMNCGIPCAPCCVEIINAGIIEIVCTSLEYYDVSAEYLITNSDLKVRVYEHLGDK